MKHEAQNSGPGFNGVYNFGSIQHSYRSLKKDFSCASLSEKEFQRHDAELD